MLGISLVVEKRVALAIKKAALQTAKALLLNKSLFLTGKLFKKSLWHFLIGLNENSNALGKAALL